MKVRVFVVLAMVLACALVWDVSPIAGLGFVAIGLVGAIGHWLITRPEDEEMGDVESPRGSGHDFKTAA